MRRRAIKPLLINESQVGAGFAHPIFMPNRLAHRYIYGCAACRNRNNALSRRLPTVFLPRRCHKRQHTSARGSMAVGGGPTHAPVIVGTAGTPLYHRVETPTQT